MDRTSLSCAWLEAPHKQIYDQGGSPLIFSGTREEAPADYDYVGFKTEIHFKPRASQQAELHTTREAPHKQNYDQGAYPQAELRPGSWLAGWLAELHTTRVPVMRLAGWLAGGLAGWLAEAKRGPERPREAERG